jgi:hypothetical protein
MIVNAILDHLGSNDFAFKMFQSNLDCFNSLLKKLSSFAFNKDSSVISLSNSYNILLYKLIDFLWTNAEELSNLFWLSSFLITHEENLLNVSKEVSSFLSSWFSYRNSKLFLNS